MLLHRVVSAVDGKVVTPWLFLHSPEDKDPVNNHYHSCSWRDWCCGQRGCYVCVSSYSLIVPPQSWRRGPLQWLLPQCHLPAQRGIGAADREVVMCVSHLTLWLFLHSPEDEDLFSDYYHSAIFLHREGLVLRTEGLLFVCLSYSVIVPRQSWSQGPCQRRLTQLFMEGLVLWTETLLHVCLTLWLFLHCSPEDKDLFSDC